MFFSFNLKKYFPVFLVLICVSSLILGVTYHLNTTANFLKSEELLSSDPSSFSEKTVQDLIRSVISYYFSDDEENRSLSAINSQKTVNIPIIMYHSLLKDTSASGDYTISPDMFYEDMRYIKSKGFETISARELLDFTKNGSELPEKPIMITFDDGHYNNYEYAFPVLDELEMNAIISVVGTYSEEFNQSGDVNISYSYLTHKQISELAVSPLIEFSNHSYDLHSYTSGRRGILRANGESYSEYVKLLVADTTKNMEYLISCSVSSPLIYTYPFGMANDESGEILERLGYEITFGCEEGINTVDDISDLKNMKRFNRPSFISTSSFFDRIFELSTD